MLVLVLSFVFALNLSYIAFAATADGASTTATYGSHAYTSYNRIITNSSGVQAGTSITCSPTCSSGQIGIYPLLQNSDFLIVKSIGWVYNSTNNCTGIYTTTGVHPATSGTFYSGGTSQGWNDSNNRFYGLSVPLSPGLTVGSSASGGTGIYGVNENGQTYGKITNETDLMDCPDLIGAVGLDGTVGFVLSKDLLYSRTPASPEEAAALMNNKEHIQGRMINLYDSDGVTVIGQFFANSLIGVTVHENGITTTYNEDGTIVTTYDDGRKDVTRWR